MAASYDLLLAFLGGDFILEALALDLRLGFIRLQLRFGVSLPGLGLTALRVGLSVDPRLLQATFTRQIAIADERPGDLLRLTGDPAS
jgi:hypothetical protein